MMVDVLSAFAAGIHLASGKAGVKDYGWPVIRH
jgi:hypothetical protein